MEKVLGYLSWIDGVAGFAWTILTFIMIGVLYQIYQKKGIANLYFYLGLVLLAIVWLYPLYTSFYMEMEIGVVWNIFTLLISGLYMLWLKNISPRLSRFLIPQVIWLFVATVHVGLMLVDKQ